MFIISRRRKIFFSTGAKHNENKIRVEVISGGSRIFKTGGGHKIVDACCLLRTPIFNHQNQKVGGGQK